MLLYVTSGQVWAHMWWSIPFEQQSDFPVLLHVILMVILMVPNLQMSKPSYVEVGSFPSQLSPITVFIAYTI